MKNEKLERICESIDNVNFDELQMLEDYIKLKKSGFGESEHDPKPTGGLLGWICPVCGRALSPFANYCPFCNNKNTNWWDPNKIAYALLISHPNHPQLIIYIIKNQKHTHLLKLIHLS